MSESKQPGADSASPAKPARGGLMCLIKDAWNHEALNDRTPRGRAMALVRVIGTTVKGVLHNKIPLQAAGLTYYTLMSIGPMLALALTLGGFILSQQEDGHRKLKGAITSIIQSVAPQTAVAPAAKPVADDPAAAATVVSAPAADSKPDVAGLDIDSMVDKLLSESAKGGVSAIGLVILVVLAVLMLSKVENAFNSIWNVRKGRPWKDRFINYFLFMAVSCMLGAASLTMLSGASLAKGLDGLPEWMRNMPWLFEFLTGAGPTLISLGLMTVLVALFNKFMPNAKVRWRPALGGGVLVAAILIANQKLGALYAGKVAGLNKLYGPLSLILVLMFGLYLSWLFLLVGGQFTFSLQNSRALAAYNTWEGLSARTKQILCFGCLIMVGRRFRGMQLAPDSEEMASMLHVPRSITDQCVARLMELKLIVAVDDGDDNPDNDRYRPDFPLQSLTVAQIKDRLESYNGNVTIDPKLHTDAGLARFDATYGRFTEIDDARLSFDELLATTERTA